jgi:threonine synthase
MGLPIHLVAAVNKNDIVAKLIDTGVYAITGPVHPSLASAMDIQAISSMSV